MLVADSVLCFSRSVSHLARFLIAIVKTNVYRIKVSENHGFFYSLKTKWLAAAGISHNKLLAKLASAMNKPNKQTIVPTHALTGLMREYLMPWI